MSTKTTIEWTEQTWNPTVGCSKISPGCAHCYAEVMAKRLRAMGVKAYENEFRLTLLPERLAEPMKRKRPTVYFVNSMSDLFHDGIPDSYLLRVMEAIRQAPQHTFQILTKRAARMAEFFRENQPPPNAWLGVTAENCQHGLPRLNILRGISAAVRFVSMEPLLEDLGEVDLTGLHWVIVGGESGPDARPMQPEWVLNLQRQCDEQEVAFFFKQWGGWGVDGKKRGKKKNGRLLNGRIWDAAPRMESLVLDSFSGSGTTGAVAHKMGRRWIMVELGEHCHTHIVPRLKKVIDGEDPGGITKAVNWKGGGGFRYYRLAPSLLEKDRWGNWVINKTYNANMLAEALCKLEGFTYAPSDSVYWQHGHSTEQDFIYITTASLTHEQLQELSDEVGSERSLLVLCTAFRGRDDYANLTVKKIPRQVLSRCEWGHDDYSLKVENLPPKPPDPGQLSLFGEEGL